MTQTPTPRREPPTPWLDNERSHYPSCCGACEPCLSICWGYHGRERRSGIERRYIRPLLSEAVTQALSELEEAVGGLAGKWVAERAYPGDHHGIDYIDRSAVIQLIHDKQGSPEEER